MKSSRSNKRRRHRQPDQSRQRKASPTAKLNCLPEDQVALIVAWLFQGKTYAEIRLQVKERFGVTCSLMAVKTMWDKYAAMEEQMRSERIVRRARMIMGGATL